MLRLADAWAWDFWLADTGTDYHLFFLRASRALQDPDLRHHRAGVGHAVSTDLVSWTRLPDALDAGESPAFDDLATWTGSIIRGPDGTWFMFYTGATNGRGGLVQRIGLATSADLLTWRKRPESPVVTADSRWYESAEDGGVHGETWRDPWVFPDPHGDGWHMLITARANNGPPDDRGVIGHAHSRDLLRWQAQPPLSTPGAGFSHLEVPQVEVIDGRAVLIFSCLVSDLSGARQRSEKASGVWAADGDSVLGPFDIAAAKTVTDHTLYSGRILRNRRGEWVMLAFHNEGSNGFVGEISDPMPVRLSQTGPIEIVRPRPVNPTSHQ